MHYSTTNMKFFCFTCLNYLFNFFNKNYFNLITFLIFFSVIPPPFFEKNNLLRNFFFMVYNLEQ